MTKYLFGLSFGLVAFLLATSISSAQPRNMCADRSAVMQKLVTKFGETRRSMGLATNSGIVELHASDDTGSWTITVTHPNGITCLVAAGNSFEMVEDELPASLGAPT
ncbi:hypothetical protein [uncultured Litoreibacter sp.]|uniref:hypothetical protein n=1 Tax=uncultured Litoreibacter sp. TaxID=1392394 RepID=UPI002604642D|nr:hypothetical protein [uncultured Litoreibacter sp.]